MDEFLNLVNLAKLGNEDAYERIAQKYQALLLSMSQQYSNMCPEMSEDMDDFFQEANIALVKAVRTYDESRNITFGAYAKVCIRNHLVSYVRSLKSQKRKANKRLEQSQSKTARIEDVVQEELLGVEKTRELRSFIRKSFSLYERRIFEMKASEMSVSEMAERLQKSEKSINNALYRMRRKLSRFLKNNDT